MNERNTTIDFLKSLAIIMVLITHYNWSDEQRKLIIFPYIIEMAVPIFMIISGYVGTLSFKKHDINTLNDAYKLSIIFKKMIRYTIPYLMLVILEIIDPHVEINVQSKLDYVKWFLNGTVGQGSYYFPILIQLIFTFPIIYFIVEKSAKRGVILCFTINCVYELLRWSYEMNDECYRLLLFRYIIWLFVSLCGYIKRYNLCKY
ncbi:MAG: acyltransferase [Lachnospiraceae bacterium]|jgi:fucose 4-O-acetylase-like acetyltransferase|nr:acyltransferase [Lachnospiraceae bacterium]